MTSKNEPKAYQCDIWYTASGYADDMTATAMRVFFFFADSFGDAAVKAFDTFAAYRKCQTKEPKSDYYGLYYDIDSIRLEETK